MLTLLLIELSAYDYEASAAAEPAALVSIKRKGFILYF